LAEMSHTTTKRYATDVQWFAAERDSDSAGSQVRPPWAPLQQDREATLFTISAWMGTAGPSVAVAAS